MATENLTEDALATQRYAKRSIFLLSGTFFFLFAGAGAQQLYIAPYLQDCTDWTGMMRGMVAASVYISMMVFRVANVYLLRGWSHQRLTLVGSLTYTLFTAAMLATFHLKSYPLALAGAIIWGWGGAAMWTGTTMMVFKAAQEGKRYGISTGILYSATHAGWLAGTIVLGIVYQNQNWEPYTIYVVAMAITIIGNVLAALHPVDDDSTMAKPQRGELRELMQRSKVRIAGFLLTTSSLSFGFMLSVFGDHVKAQFGEEYIWVTAMFYPGCRMVTSIIGGALNDRIGQAWTMAGGFVSAALALWLATQWSTVASAAIAATALALLNGTVPVVATAMIGDSADSRRQPLAYGAVFAFRDLGVALAAVWGKVLMGPSAEFTHTFNTFALVFLACGAVALMLRKHALERL